jgi:hypothetical protein
MAAVNPQHVWKGVIEEGTGWAYIDTNHLKKRMLDMVGGEYPRLKAKAVKHGKWIRDNYNKNYIYLNFVSLITLKEESIDDKMIFLDSQPEIQKISFCISTNGLKHDKTIKTINSIKNTILKSNIAGEIIVCGNINNFKNIDNIKLLDYEDFARKGFLAKLRNIAANNSSGEIIIFLDDDIIFEKDWLDKFISYNKTNKWDILGNKILLPDGGRYWDRAILNPHQMVPYDSINENDQRLYQTGCFWIIRRSVFENNQWDSTIEYYAEKNGKINEDVEYSNRLKNLGFRLSFDKNNTVWHWDDSYQEVLLGNGISICLKKDMIPASLIRETEEKKEFSELIRGL